MKNYYTIYVCMGVGVSVLSQKQTMYHISCSIHIIDIRFQGIPMSKTPVIYKLILGILLIIITMC